MYNNEKYDRHGLTAQDFLLSYINGLLTIRRLQCYCYRPDMFLQASRKHGLHSSQTNGLSPEWTRMLVSRCWAWENDFENFYQAMAFLQNLQISSIWIRIEKYFEHSLQHMSESQTGAGNLNLHALENTTFFTGICLQKMAFPQKGLLPRNSFSPKMTSPLKMVSPQKMAFSSKKKTFLLDLVFSCCVVFTTFFMREMKMNSPYESL